MHEAYAGVLERTPGSAQEVVGHHLEAAYRQRLALGPADADTAALAIRAGRALHAAGSRAMSREESRLATALLRRAVELVQVDRSALAAVLPDLVEALVALPDLDAADRVHGDAVELARALGDRTNELRAEMAWARTGYLRDAEGWDAWCERIADEAIEHFGPLGDDANLAQAWLLAAAAYLGTEIAPGVERLRRAEVHARRVDDERARIRIWDELGGAMLQGRTPYPEVLDFTRQEIAWARERGITFTEADGMLGEAYGIVASGDLAAARTALDQVRVLFASLPGVVAQHGESYTLGGTLELDDGDPVAAEALFRRAMELFHEAGNRRWARSAAAGLAHALLDQSRPDEAASVLEALAAQPATASVRSDARVLDARARLAAARGDRITALDLARQAVDVLADSDSIQAAAGTHEVLADILASMGDVAGARRALRSASALYAEKAYEPGSARIARLLREIDARPHVS
jgi:tetratricopeptide (TPR) repeat protein